MEHLDLREATLVGFSMGGGEVVRYLGRYGSDRVGKAVLAAAVPPYLFKSADNIPRARWTMPRSPDSRLA